MTVPAENAIAALSKQRHEENGLLASRVLETVPFDSLIDLLPSTDQPAVISIDERSPITHARLREFVQKETFFSNFGLGRNDRVAILMPNGPELAVAFVAVLSYCTCAPLNPANTITEIKHELVSVNAKAILILAEENNRPLLEVAEELDIAVMIATPSSTECGTFELKNGLLDHPQPRLSDDHAHFQPQRRGDVAMVLHTSGSTGNKKVVPHALEDLLAGALCIASACQLKPSDICLNQMPLFHIGGIARNVLSPILSGGAVVAMPYFEPSVFWKTCIDQKCTWYYAGPTMHMLILDAYKALDPSPAIHLRFIANAAGPLPPSVAVDMRDTYTRARGAFCSIMPSYGMTECMPISSPPVGYNLERPGTSGQIVGPRCQIQDGDGYELPRGETHVGQIMVQGHPVMLGYENNPEENAANFVNGWFKTGDLGYMDDDNFLYLTGRSKEVINRGGEIISPVEVEDALLSHPDLKNVVAFSTPHDILQEAIGVCVVAAEGKPRVGLSGLQAHASLTLHPSKWPNLVVYASDIPKTSTGKAMRVRLDKRMKLPSINDETPMWQRLFEAEMLPAGSAVQAPIPTKPVEIKLAEISNAINNIGLNITEVHTTMCHYEGKEVIVSHVVPETAQAEAILQALRATLHEYLLPFVIMPIAALPRTASGEIAEQELPLPLPARSYASPTTSTEEKMQQIWMGVLCIDSSNPPSVEDDFFLIGGTSLLASSLAAMIKKEFGMPLSGTALFKMRTIVSLSKAVDDHVHAQLAKAALVPRQSGILSDDTSDKKSQLFRKKSSASFKKLALEEASRTLPENPTETHLPIYNQSRPLAMLVQSLPLCLLHPFKRMLIWGFFVVLFLSLLQPTEKGGPGINRVAALIIAITGARIGAWICFPIVGIAFKWILIGKYFAGRYPIWGSYYLRWWLAHQIVNFCGRGFFDITPQMRNVYYRLMGAKIGAGCSLGAEVTLTEFDLVQLGENVFVDDKVIISPFCVDGGEMMLSAIDVGSNCSVGTKSILAPGAFLPAGTHLTPLSSSYEIPSTSAPGNRQTCREAFKGPGLWVQAVLGAPIICFIQLIANTPIIFLVIAMVEDRSTAPSSWWEALDWFTSGRRLAFFFLIRFARKCICPIVEFACVVCVKRLVIGKFVEGPCSSWYPFQYWLMRRICSPDLCGVSSLVGNHWEGVTICMRLLGAKCGKRIFWPGSGLDVVEYDLLEIGDDAVFGSRSCFLCSDGEYAKGITLMAGANVADRCVVAPGVTLGVNACLGSGSFAPAGTSYLKGAVTLGNSHGCTVVLNEGGPGMGNFTKEETLKPFGRTFYERKTTDTCTNTKPVMWKVPPLQVFVAYVWSWSTFAACYRAAMLPVAIIFLDGIAGGRSNIVSYLVPNWRTDAGFLDAFGVYMVLLALCYAAVHAIGTTIALVLDIWNKWRIVGRRQPGEYPWDTSDYCMQWNYYLTSAAVRKGLLEQLGGSVFLVWYFRALGCSIGRNVCLYPTGSDPMMTEPDLVSIGDNACINYCFIICHVNSKGVFSLNTITIEKNSTMRSFSRLMAGARLMEGARLLEHTLALIGDVVEANSIWQGWPVHDMTETEAYWGARRQRLRAGMSQFKQMRPGGKHYSLLKASQMEHDLSRLRAEKSNLKLEIQRLRFENSKLVEQHELQRTQMQKIIDELTSKMSLLTESNALTQQSVVINVE